MDFLTQYMTKKTTFDQQKAMLQNLKNIRSGATLDQTYVIMNVLATTLSCYGIFVNSPTVVIGAMLSGLLLGPIIAIALALVEGDNVQLKKAILTEAAGICIVYLVAFVLALMHSNIPLTHEVMSRTSPNFIDLMVALAGGTAGAYALLFPNRLGLSLVGVAIATSLIPPLCSSAILITHGKYALAAGALSLTLTNIVAIQFASSITILMLKYKTKLFNPIFMAKTLSRNLISIIILTALGSFLFISMGSVINEQSYKLETRLQIDKALKNFDGNILSKLHFEKKPESIIIRAVVQGPHTLTPENIALIEKELPLSPIPIDLRIRFIKTTVTTSHGSLFTDIDEQDCLNAQ